MRTLNGPNVVDRDVAWLDTEKMDSIPYSKIAAALLFSSDSGIVGAVYILFVNLFSFEWLVTTWPFNISVTGVFVALYGLMFIGGAIGIIHLDKKYHFVKNRAVMITILLLRLVLFVGSLLLTMVTTELVKVPVDDNGGFSPSCSHPLWPLILVNVAVFLIIEFVYYKHVVIPVEFRFLEPRRKREKAEKKQK